jgi:hypothetical protein
MWDENIYGDYYTPDVSGDSGPSFSGLTPALIESLVGTAGYGPSSAGAGGDTSSGFSLDSLKQFLAPIIKPFMTAEGKPDLRAIATLGGGLLPLLMASRGGGGGRAPASYQGGIPQLTAQRQAIPAAMDPNRVPGSGGQRYFTDVQYTPKGAQGGLVSLQDGGFVVPADVVSHLGNGSSKAGLAHLAQRGAVPIQGKGDGMSDSIPGTINGRQRAAVADGEAYIPPKAVQRMGGPKALYETMERVRKDRTGTPRQGRQINPNDYV